MPGSTVPTSLIRAEQKRKHYGVIEFDKRGFFLETYFIRTQREMLLEEIHLTELKRKARLNAKAMDTTGRNDSEQIVIDYLLGKYDFEGYERKPLMRIRIHLNELQEIDSLKLETAFKDAVANPGECFFIVKRNKRANISDDQLIHKLQNKQPIIAINLTTVDNVFEIFQEQIK